MQAWNGYKGKCVELPLRIFSCGGTRTGATVRLKTWVVLVQYAASKNLTCKYLFERNRQSVRPTRRYTRPYEKVKQATGIDRNSCDLSSQTVPETALKRFETHVNSSQANRKFRKNWEETKNGGSKVKSPCAKLETIASKILTTHTGWILKELEVILASFLENRYLTLDITTKSLIKNI